MCNETEFYLVETKEKWETVYSPPSILLGFLKGF